MNIKLYQLMQRIEETNQRIEDHLPENFKNLKEVRELEMITRLSNVMHVISWDTFLEIVRLRNVSSRRRTEISMPM